MPTLVFKCESCGDQKPHLVHESEMRELQEKNLIQKHCLTCRTLTNWVIAFPERRSGQDRRSRRERRTGIP